MAQEQLGLCVGRETADADYTTKQFFGVKFSATGVALCSTLGEAVDGFLQNAPDLGEVANVCIDGVSKAVASGAIAKGTKCSINAAGKLTTALTTHYIVGSLLEAATADGDVVSFMINRHGRLA